jgi:protocatechuate 3,4-dioxygenase beta subunit
VPALAEARPAWISVSLLPSGKGGAPHRATLLARAPGTFDMPALEPDTYDVAIQQADHGYARAEQIRIEPGKTSEAHFEFPGDQVVAGRVVDASGAPVSGATVDAYLADAGGQAAYVLPGRAPDNFSGNTAHTAEDGSFRLAGLRAAPHRVRVYKPGEAPLETTIAGSARNAPVTLRLPRPAALEVALGPSAASKIVLIETKDGGGQRESAITDAGGVARFPALSAGSYDVKAIVPGFAAERVALAAGDTAHVTLGSGPQHR